MQRQGFIRGPVDIYGEMELLRLLDQFFDRALCFATKGYEQYMQLQSGSESLPPRSGEGKPVVWVRRQLPQYKRFHFTS